MLKQSLIMSASLMTLSSALVTSAIAQDAIDEIVVTARKKAESLQDVPIAVSALGEAKLDELGVDVFTDYLVQMPGVSAGGSGPGQNTIYIRGVASTTPNLATAGVAGLAPNVALYLDEQPLGQPGRNLDVYAVDLERVEVLAGPQGTLFGASSQAGVVRLITNKPKLDEEQYSVNADVGFTKDGEGSRKVEMIFNQPISDTLAIRGAIFNDFQGGYIDNVAGTIDASESARFREAGTVRANGVPVSEARAGVQSRSGILAARARGDFSGDHDNNPDTVETDMFGVGSGDRELPGVGQSFKEAFPDVTFNEADNTALVEDDFNDATYSGFRLGVLKEFNDDWSLNVNHMQQSVESDGVFFVDPDLGDLEIQRYEQDTLSDDFHNTNWTLEGRLAELDILYTGAFTKRETNQRVDYTDYLFVGQYLPYYICDSTVSYPEYNYPESGVEPNPILPSDGYVQGTPFGVCQAPNLFVTSNSEIEVWSHEFRVQTDQDMRLRGTAGVFVSETELKERVDFTYPGSENAHLFPHFESDPSLINVPGFHENGYFETANFRTGSETLPTGAIFRNDIERTDDQFGLFGEASYDIVPSALTFTLGARQYDVEVDMRGSANSSFGNGFGGDKNAFGTNITDLYDGDGRFTFITDTNTATHITFVREDLTASGDEVGLDADRDVAIQQIKDALEAADPWSTTTRGFNGANLCFPNAICKAEVEAIYNAVHAPDKATTDGTIVKANLAYTPNDDLMVYATYSEGFRPGLLNRPGGAAGPNNYTVPFELQTDEVNNYEFGWKTTLLDGQLRFNGNAFFVDIKNLQTTMFDPNIVNLFFSDNAADAEIKGVEGDFIYAVPSVDGLQISGAFSFLDSEITEVHIPTNDVIKGAELAFAPEFSSNVSARYAWPVANGATAYVFGQATYTGSSRSDIIEMNAGEIDSSTVLNVSTGLSTDSWSVAVYAENLTDERAQISNNFVNDRNRLSIIRPLTVGLRLGRNF
jgi:iron complex outermembrane receptor protein